MRTRTMPPCKPMQRKSLDKRAKDEWTVPTTLERDSPPNPFPARGRTGVDGQVGAAPRLTKPSRGPGSPPPPGGQAQEGGDNF